MTLQAITLSVDPTLSYLAAKELDTATTCAFCGASAGPWIARAGASPGQQQAAPACALCHLPQHLERASIDEEAILVWLPEISQPALSATLREIHIALRSIGEDLHANAVFRTRAASLSNLFYTRTILTERRHAAEARVGTASPSELGLALLELSPAAYARRGELLEGLRLLPLGRVFEDDRDVYPEIVDFWRSHHSALSAA
jgi:intracellular multiplication protein IcmJ